MKQLAKAEVLHRNGDDVDPRFSTLNRWTFLMMQIFECQTYLDLAEGKYAAQSDLPLEDLLVAQSLFRSAVISYGKCFASSGKNRSSLDANKVFFGTPDLVPIHKRLVDLRNKSAAHSDQSGLDEAIVDVQELPQCFVIGTCYAFAIPYYEFSGYRQVVSAVEKYVMAQTSKATTSLEVRLGKKIINRNRNG